jgi:hypothetical protein
MDSIAQADLEKAARTGGQGGMVQIDIQSSAIQ